MTRPKKNKRPGTVGQNILRLRRLRGWSQYRLADESGVHRVTVAALETGGHAAADTATIEKFARALGVRSSELLAETGNAEVEPLLQEYMASPWYQDDNPTHEEIEWLRSLPGIFWAGGRPTPKTVHYLIEAKRTRRPQ